MMVNEFALDCIKNPHGWETSRVKCVDLLLRISNTLYNSTSSNLLPLDDGVYDQLLEIYKKYNPRWQVGSTEMEFSEIANEDFDQHQVLYRALTDLEMNSKLYINDLHIQVPSLLEPMRNKTLYHLVREPITKRMINTPHKYPELVGTLDKCKFVLNHDAQMAGVWDNPAVQIFERDFIHPCMASGIIRPNDVFTMIGELKYDGVSIEAEVCRDRILTALSRGDTSNDVATDLTPILGGYRFPKAACIEIMEALEDEVFGIKFEAVIRHHDLERLGALRGKAYKNGRNAIVGLLGSSDGYKYTDYITLIPIATSFEGVDRIKELQFLNKYYSTGEWNRYCTFTGNYQEILFHVKQFTESAEIIRKILPYMIDGVVVSFTDPDRKRLLGRVNSVNKWQIAIKFNPKENRTIFLGYTYSIGKSGEVIPLAHFKPVEFIGTIHTKQSVHSFQRFRELALIKGQEIDVTYMNDVLTYISKPDTEHNRQLQAIQPPEDFIAFCPSCGSRIVLSETLKSARCPNPWCKERRIMTMVDMVERLGFKDISEDVVRTLNLTRFIDIVKSWDKSSLVEMIGPLTAEKFLDYREKLLFNPIEDYRIMAALSFEGLAEEKWKKMLREYKLDLIYKMNEQSIRINLGRINGIGPAIVQSVIDGFTMFKEDMDFILRNMTLINFSDKRFMPKVVLTGTRDPQLIEIANSLGYDCSDSYQVTKDTHLVITADLNSTSGKIQKAMKYGIKIVDVGEFLRMHNIQL